MPWLSCCITVMANLHLKELKRDRDVACISVPQSQQGCTSNISYHQPQHQRSKSWWMTWSCNTIYDIVTMDTPQLILWAQLVHFCWKYFGEMWPYYTETWLQQTKQWESGPRFNIKMTSYQYRKSHCRDKMIWRPSYLHNGISFTGKMTSLYWIRAQEAFWNSLLKMAVEKIADKSPEAITLGQASLREAQHWIHGMDRYLHPC